MAQTEMNPDGSCPDCGHKPIIGEWPFPCDGRDHRILGGLAFFPKGVTREYASPLPINPFERPQVSRDWLNPDGTTRPMVDGEWEKAHLPEAEGAVDIV